MPTGELGILDYLINELGQDAVGKDRAGLTTVHAATQSERIDTVKVSGASCVIWCVSYHVT